MDKKRSIIVCSVLFILFGLMIFIEIDDQDKSDNHHEDEIIYLSHDEAPILREENLSNLIDSVPHKTVDEEIINNQPEIGRLAVSSVLLNKKPSSQTIKIEDNSNISIAEQHNELSYKIFQGQRFSAVLTHAIQSDLPGMVVAEISQDIYGYQSYVPLLPKGSRLVGVYNNGLNRGDSRLFIMWQRAITPSGIDIQLESPGTDRLGQSGLTGVVDTHFWEIFGTSSLLSVMAVGTSNLSSEQGEFSNQYQQGVTEALVDTSHDILNNRIDRKPTIHIAQGTIVHVVVAKDLDFSAVLKQESSIQIF